MKKDEIKKDIEKWIKKTKNQNAFIHISKDSENNYEKLEILGDSYLNFFTVNNLYDKYKTPAEITKLKKSLVSNKNLYRTYDELNLSKYIQVGESLTIDQISSKTKADFIEAIIGALYFDSKKDKKYENLLKDFIESFIIEGFNEEQMKDYKSFVYEKARKNNIEIKFDHVRLGPDHKIEHIATLIAIFPDGEEKRITRTAATIKQAEQECCREIWEHALFN